MKSLAEPLSAQEMAVAPSRDELRATFDMMTASTYDGVPGVLRIDSDKPEDGPVVGITALTHGNEPSGLAPIMHFFRNDRLKKLLVRGSVLFTVNNIDAAAKYFSTLSEEDRLHLRQLEVNMNRLPENILRLTNDKRYEIRRTLELCKIFEQFDAGLDIHSTYSSTKPMIIQAKGNERRLCGFPIQVILTNMLNVQRGIPVSALYGGIKGKDIPVVGIEAGTHEGPEAPRNATIATQAFLQNLGMIQGVPDQLVEAQHVYRISTSVLFPNSSYDFVQEFQSFDPVVHNAPLAIGDGEPVPAPQSGHILFPKPKGFNVHNDEAAFISDRVKKLNTDGRLSSF